MTSARTMTKRLTTPLTSFGRAREGAIAATVGMSIVVLAGALALVFDLGKLYNVSTEFDNAADAAALAGATQLDQTAGSCARAAAGAANASLRNEETFADNPDPINPLVWIDPVLVSNRNGHIRFLSVLQKDADYNIIGDYIDDDAGGADPAYCDANAEYIEVTVNLDSLGAAYEVNFIFAPVVGAIARASPVGYAIAGLGTAFCGVVPMMMCALDPDDTGPLTPSDFWNDLNANTDNYRGRGVWLKSGLNNVQWGSGDFGFLAVGGALSGGGANILRQALGMADPPLFCLGDENLETEPGNSSGARQGFNTRFGIYEGGGVIDKTHAQWQPAPNTVKGWVRDQSGCGRGNGWGDPGRPYTGPGSIEAGRSTWSDPFTTLPIPPPMDFAMGYPMDACAYAGGAGDCDADSTTNDDRMGEALWDINAYLAVNHDMTVIDAEIAGLTGAALAIPNPPDYTRLEVYEWELGYPGTYGTIDYSNHHMPDNAGAIQSPGSAPIDFPMALGTMSTQPAIPQAMEYSGPQGGDPFGDGACYTGLMGNVQGVTLDQDRRIMNVAVVDCFDTTTDYYPIRGRATGVDADGFIQFFLLTPWQVNGSVHEIYAEIVGPVQLGIETELARVFVQLYE